MERGPAREAVAAGQQAGTHGGGVESGSRVKKRGNDSPGAEPAPFFVFGFSVSMKGATDDDPLDSTIC